MTIPTNGAPSTTPSALQPAARTDAPAGPAAPQKAPEWVAAEARTAELEAKLAAADKKLRVNGIEVMKVATEKKTMGAKLAAHDRMEKAIKAAGVSPELLERARVNPEPVFRAILGDQYYDKMVELRLNGGAPSSDVLASELSRTKDEIRAELKAEAEAEKAAAVKARQDNDEQVRAELTAGAGSYFSKSKSDYPHLSTYPDENIAKAISQLVEQEWNRTGKALTNKEAADRLEWSDVSGRFARGDELPQKTLEKYRPQLLKLTERLHPATVPPVAPKSEGQDSRSSQVERRTLSNDLKATTPTAKRTHRTDEERTAAVMALNLDR